MIKGGEKVKKDKQWVISELTKSMNFFKAASRNGFSMEYFYGKELGTREAIQMIEKLDEPEEITVEQAYDKIAESFPATTKVTSVLEKYYLDVFIEFSEEKIGVLKQIAKKTRNGGIVPKQGELEAKIQELIETYKQEDGQYSNPENYWIDGFISNLEHLLEIKKYVVVDSKGSYILAKVKSEIMTMGEILEFYGHESVDIDYNLTEQEIKDYDSRYMTFAKPVEELEE